MTLIIGLVGPMGSGKTTVAKYLTSQRFIHIRFSSYLEPEIKNKGLTLERKNYQDVGNLLRKTNGLDYISQLILKDIRSLNEKDIVLEGFRNPGEVTPFKNKETFSLIALVAADEVRFKRLNKQNRDSKEWEEFLIGERRDQGFDEPEWGQNVLGCLQIADYTIETSRSKEVVLKEIDNLIEKLRSK